MPVLGTLVLRGSVLRAFCATVCLASLAPAMAAGAADKPNFGCASIAFHPVPAALSDGEQEAGHYKAVFGRIDVKALMKGGVAQNYFVEVNGKPLNAISGPLPPSVAACARLKGLSASGKPLQPCIADRLVVLIGHSADRRYILLYGRPGGAPRFCSAGLVP